MLKMTTVGKNEEKNEVLSESEYSGDSAEDRGEEVDELVDTIRSKYPHLSRKKVAGMTRAWRGRKAAAIRRKAEKEELIHLRKAVARKNKMQMSVAQAPATTAKSGFRKPQPAPRTTSLGKQPEPENIFAAFF